MQSASQLVFITLLSAAAGLTYAAGAYDLWEMNITIKSDGRSMPLQSMQSCMLKGQDHPTPLDKSCKVSSSGGLTGKGAMQMECDGPPPYSIRIEGTRSANAMSGTMTVNSSGTTMVQEFTGKVIGSCDVATFVARSPSASGMPPGGMQMPSFDPASRRPMPPSMQETAPQAAEPSEATPAQAQKEPAKDNLGNAVDAAKKALGGLFGF